MDYLGIKSRPFSPVVNKVLLVYVTKTACVYWLCRQLNKGSSRSYKNKVNLDLQSFKCLLFVFQIPNMFMTINILHKMLFFSGFKLSVSSF